MTDLWGTLHRNDTHGSVSLEHVYDTGPDDLWQALTDPDRLARWMAPVTGNLAVGGDYLLVFDGTDPDSRTWGTIEACDAPHELQVTWISPGDAEPSRVHVMLVAEGDGTRLRLVHSGLSHQQDIGHAAGWEVHLRQLVDAIEHPDQATDADWWASWTGFRDAHTDRLAASAS